MPASVDHDTEFRAMTGRHFGLHLNDLEYGDPKMANVMAPTSGTSEAANDHSRYQICLIHPFDPRGQKVGGLETYIRDFITFHPQDTDILFIGVDSFGDLELGKVHSVTFRGRRFDFMPILRYTDEQAREAATTVRGSLTGQFFTALLRYFRSV